MTNQNPIHKKQPYSYHPSNFNLTNPTKPSPKLNHLLQGNILHNHVYNTLITNYEIRENVTQTRMIYEMSWNAIWGNIGNEQPHWDPVELRASYSTLRGEVVNVVTLIWEPLPSRCWCINAFVFGDVFLSSVFFFYFGVIQGRVLNCVLIYYRLVNAIPWIRRKCRCVMVTLSHDF